MKGTAFITAAVLLSGVSAASAQSVETPPVPDTQSPPAAAARPAPQMPAQAPGSQLTPAKLERIYHIRQLEAMLANAVKAGASTFASQVQAEPNSLFVTTTARARGFELEGYGVFFDVDVPSIMPSMLWASQQVQSGMQDVYDLRETVNNPKTDPRVRRIAEIELRRLERALGLPSPPSAASAMNAANALQPPPGVAMAATTDAAPASSPAAVAPLPDPRDPNEIYTEAIKAKLIDAMLMYSNALRIADEEWLTVAARATSQGQGSGLDDSSSIVLRIKGTDLTAFVTGKISREEAVKRVEIKES